MNEISETGVGGGIYFVPYDDILEMKVAGSDDGSNVGTTILVSAIIVGGLILLAGKAIEGSAGFPQ